jgi:beta-glucosidase
VLAPLLLGCASKSASGGRGGTDGAAASGGRIGSVTGGSTGTGATSGTGGAAGSGARGAGGAGGSTGTGGASMACNPAGAITAGSGGAAACQSNPADYANPYRDPCRPIEDRITDLLSLLTLAEKQTMLGSTHPAIARLNLPGAPLGTEGLHGISSGADPASARDPSTQFPQAFGLGQSWDPEALKTVGAVTGNEARVYRAFGTTPNGRNIGLVIRAPNVDLARDPRWGRVEESYGEDPYLIGELAKGFLAGLHGSDPKILLAASMLKHFAANSNENTRVTSSSNLDDRNLREYYTATFGTAVRDGRANAIMTAYNKINDRPAAVTPLLKSLVMGEWGFRGFFCTDGSAASLLVPPSQQVFPTLEQSVAAIVKGGTGMLLQGSATMPLATTVASAFTMGLLTEADVDAALRPVLRVRFQLGDFDPPSYVPYGSILGTDTPWNTPESHAKALDVSRKTVVLLKNVNRALPLDRAAIRSVAVIGPRADSFVKDWYGGLPPYTVTGRQGIVNKLGASIPVRLAATDDLVATTPAAAVTAATTAATAAAAMSDVALVFVGNHPTCGSPPPAVWGTCRTPYEGREAVDRTSIALEPPQAALVQAVAAANPRTIVVMVSSFPQGIGPIESNANVPAILQIANSGQELGNAVADVLFGDYNPAGRTTMTWYRTETDIPTALTDYDIRKGTTYWYFAGTPLYPFGHGLSYSTFTYANLTVGGPSVPAAPAAGSCGTVPVGVDVTNTSAVAGDEVVQLYVAYPGSAVAQRPRQQLRGFRRVNIAAGATAHVTFDIGAADLTYYDAAGARFAVETGKMVELQVGASSRDIRLRAMLAVTP